MLPIVALGQMLSWYRADF